jgi:large subunit ribosomal protein L25
MSEFKIEAVTRDVKGKGASRRLRRLEGVVPAIVYGAKTAPTNITLKHNELIKLVENEAVFSSLMTLSIDGKEETVFLKDLQRHPAKLQLMHVDFQRITQDTPINLTIPLHFINEDKCVALKTGGCTVTHAANNLQISCLPANLPEFIELDMSEAQATDVIRLSNLTLPEGVTLEALRLGNDMTLAKINKPRGGVVAEEE